MRLVPPDPLPAIPEPQAICGALACVSASERGRPTHLAEAALATMLGTMELMIDHQRVIAEAVDRAPDRHATA